MTRCNHCANPPCARICPTAAMYQRDDGIVEFDNRVCIGCKACMQACPYDAIYIDPDSNTAAKCHYCAHRTDIGLEPACVVVCPEHAIIAGDMNDPTTEIAQLLAKEQVTVRKPEQGTAPKLFYIEGSSAVLHPTATKRTPETFMWADVQPLHGANHGKNGHGGGGLDLVGLAGIRNPAVSYGGEKLRTPQPQGQPTWGPIEFGGKMAEHMAQVAYNAQHKIPWHWQVPAYLTTKGIGAGVFIILALGWGLDWFPFDGVTAVAAGFLTLLFIGLTTLFLIWDLEKPNRFAYILLRPQWRSWLTRGAVILIGFSSIAGSWWVLEAFAHWGVLGDWVAGVRPLFLWLGLPFALLTAIYTAFLFAQAEGRDLWQSPLLPAHLVIQALMAGGGMLLIVDLFIEMPAQLTRIAGIVFVAALLTDLFVTLAGEFGVAHASEVAARAAHEISHGRYRDIFWFGSILLGHIVPLMLMTAGNVWAGAFAGITAIVGLYLYEYAFVMAPQEVQNS